jgi:hypothetical protein
MSKTLGSVIVLASCAALISAQDAPNRGPAPIYRVTVVERGVEAIHYQYRSGPTKIDFRGTLLLPDAKGQATVQSVPGRSEIDAKLENLTPPSRFGREFLTYVLWAISPEGAPHNLGEIIADTSNRSRVKATTDMATFALIVTAEPYSAVAQPSSVVVLENKARPDTVGKVESVQAKAALLPRTTYTYQVDENPQPPVKAPKVSMDRYEAVLELYQAQNAIAIARAANADRYASDVMGKAQQALNEAQRLEEAKGSTKQIVQAAREATQMAEDARAVAERARQADREKPDAASTPEKAEPVPPPQP